MGRNTTREINEWAASIVLKGREPPEPVKEPPPLDPERLKKEPLVLPNVSTLGPALHIHAEFLAHHPRQNPYEVHDENDADMFAEGANPEEMMWTNKDVRRSITTKDDPRDASLGELKPLVAAELNTDCRRKDGRWNLKRKAVDHLGRTLYPGGVRRENYEDTAPLAATANAEEAPAKSRPSRDPYADPDDDEEVDEERDEEEEDEEEDAVEPGGEEDAEAYASGSEYDFLDGLVDLPADFKPANPSLGKRMKAITPELPTHLELESDFVEHMIRMAGASRTRVRKSARDLEANEEFKAVWQTYCDSIRSSPPTLQDSPDENEETEIDDPREHLMALLNLIVVNAANTFPPKGKRKCQDIVFSRNDGHAAPTFTGNKPPLFSGVLKRGQEECVHVCNTALVVDALTAMPVDADWEQIARKNTPPSQNLIKNASRVFAALGHRSHVFGLTVAGPSFTLYYIDRSGTLHSKHQDFSVPASAGPSDAPQPSGISQLISAITALCLMDDAQLGFDPLFQTSKDNCPTDTIEGFWMTLQDGKTYIIDRLVSLTSILFGTGSATYAAHPTTDFTIPDKERRVLGTFTHTIRVQWHTRPWGSTKPLYERAKLAGVPNLALVEGVAFGELLGDGFRRFCAEQCDGRYADLRPRVLCMKPECIPLCHATKSRQFQNVFISLVKAHRKLWKAGIMHRDVSCHSMLIDGNVPHRGIIAGLDLALHRFSTSEEHEILPLGDSVFQSTDLDSLPPGTPPLGHRYRYELESFLFLLLHSAARLPLDESENEKAKMKEYQKKRLAHLGRPLPSSSETKNAPPEKDRFGRPIPPEMMYPSIANVIDDLVFSSPERKKTFLMLNLLHDEDDEWTGRKPSTDPDVVHRRAVRDAIDALPWGLGQKWVLPLRNLFRAGYTGRVEWEADERPVGEETYFDKRYDPDESRKPAFDNELLDGRVSYDVFMGTLEGVKDGTGY